MLNKKLITRPNCFNCKISIKYYNSEENDKFNSRNHRIVTTSCEICPISWNNKTTCHTKQQCVSRIQISQISFWNCIVLCQVLNNLKKNVATTITECKYHWWSKYIPGLCYKHKGTRVAVQIRYTRNKKYQSSIIRKDVKKLYDKSSFNLELKLKLFAWQAIYRVGNY